MKIDDLQFTRVGELADRAVIETATLDLPDWDHENGFRVPSVQITEDKRVAAGDKYLRGLLNLGQDWIHDDDLSVVTEHHRVLDGLTDLLVPIRSINPDPDNVRLHDERNLKAVRNSLNTFGQHQPVVVQRDGMVVRIGNARLQAALSLGWTHVAALIVEEGRVNAMARAIADNKTGELAVWDFQGLASQLQQLSDDGLDLELVGFESFEANMLLDSEWEAPAATDKGLDVPDVVESPAADQTDKTTATTVTFTADQWAVLADAYDMSGAETDFAQWLVDLASTKSRSSGGRI